MLVPFRRYTLFPLDDCLYALQAIRPHLTRSALHRCFTRHGISRLPDIAGDTPAKRPCKPYPIGDGHLDIAEVRTEEGLLSLCAAIDCVCKYVYAELHAETSTGGAAQCLLHLIAAVPANIHIVLTDNGIQFTYRKRDQYAFPHHFDRVYQEHGVDHRLTHTNPPWTHGQVERMNRTLKEATVRKYYC